MKLRMIFLCLVLSLPTFADEKVIYGEDDRLDVFETEDVLHVDLAKATAAMVSSSRIQANSDNTVKISASTLESRGVCSGEKFAQQLTAATCSGFLVGPDLLVTAGHCVRSARDCASYRWVFDYAYTSENQIQNNEIEVDSSSVYHCKEIVEQVLDRGSMDDYALLRLDRKVIDRDPLEVRTEGRVEDERPLVVIGHPTGLPTKVSAGAKVRGNHNSVYFVSNLDTFGGNSGSAVFDSETGLVEGILVRGEQDYVYDSRRGCRVPKVCSDDGCRGEDVTRITNIKKLRDLL